ncbi:biotin synthase BioB [Helicobacter saguini]|uniref:Biotin synthase n=1 Tax=Helicobacter saguini TaxID=1548018 RepID=A0A347VPJ2_9HELI|nr:biotin synthase BioB [Helicobacter saguini]MWV61334.1 biotin synthase BioB [Helicobacter saguini]MWV67996.1 biotin synthase BioB [Helicobacter saguini]MWV70536.1 biotin synthase BioB [Helicobacter saguini]TLD94800.1 biotin synthase BioB [Helicobacter saguini]
MTFEKANEIFNLPFMELLYRAHGVHRENFDENMLQTSTLLSVKTGACSENCAYCAQSSHYDTGVKKESMLDREQILEYAKIAQSKGSTRFCMGASGRSPSQKELENICEIVKEVKKLGLETCVTLGLLDTKQAKALKESGLDFYNHNIDTSREFYSQVITTRTFEDRLDTIKAVRDAGLKICVGGILGLGESNKDRINMLVLLANLPTPPESIPINQLVKIPGTPLGMSNNSKNANFIESKLQDSKEFIESKRQDSIIKSSKNYNFMESKNALQDSKIDSKNSQDLDKFDFIRIIALARILMPKSYIRLSAGRSNMSEEMQALCFFAGANSVFYGDRLLTTSNAAPSKDDALFARLNLRKESFLEMKA